jgi:hypothetical protein
MHLRKLKHQAPQLKIRHWVAKSGIPHSAILLVPDMKNAQARVSSKLDRKLIHRTAFCSEDPNKYQRPYTYPMSASPLFVLDLTQSQVGLYLNTPF